MGIRGRRRADGAEAWQRLRGKPDGAYYYIVLLTAKGDSENLIAGINAGADDYVVKPFDEQELRVRLRAGRRIVELQEALQREASTDSLTGSRNRTAIYSILKRELQRAQRMTTPLGVAMVDIDHLKRLNDTHGHLAGDECLQEVTSRLHSSLRTYDSIGRWGGEEFLIVLPGCSVDTTTAIAERVRTSDRRHTCEGQGHYRHGHNQRRSRLLGRRTGSRSGHTDSCG